MTYLNYLETELGCLAIAASDKGLTNVRFVDNVAEPELNNHIVQLAKRQLTEYFQGKRQHFDLPLSPSGTDFQQQVWTQLQHIAYGQTASYQQIADNIANPKAVRAVGAANGKNPIAIIIPCHRIIGKNGTLTGYAGGLSRKAWLLDLEHT
ncbi:MAG: methylated-DNA--[protein]-cysteine S-methyltransferase [Aestuariibacter sp.]